MSPLVWDLAHIANQEELWLLREVDGREPLHPEIDPLYDAFEHPRSERPVAAAAAARAGPGLRPRGARTGPGPARPGPVPRPRIRRLRTGRTVGDTFAFGMVAQHEVQHDETMLITHQIRAGAPVLAADRPGPAPADAARLPSEVLVPGGPFTMGTSTEPWALDNERPAHAVDVGPVLPRHHAGHLRRVCRVHRGRRIRRPALVDPGRLEAPAAGRAGRAAVLEPGRRPVDPPGVRPARAGRARRAGGARVLVRGGRLRALGRAHGCRPRPSGRRRPGSTRPPA